MTETRQPAVIAADDPRRTLSGDHGRLRPAAHIQPDWWVHLTPHDMADGKPHPEAYPVWLRVRWIADTNKGNRILALDLTLEDGGNSVTVHRSSEVVMLTAREGRKLGLRGAVAAWPEEQDATVGR
jgi:hypothetical protein